MLVFEFGIQDSGREENIHLIITNYKAIFDKKSLFLINTGMMFWDHNFHLWHEEWEDRVNGSPLRFTINKLRVHYVSLKIFPFAFSYTCIHIIICSIPNPLFFIFTHTFYFIKKIEWDEIFHFTLFVLIFPKDFSFFSSSFTSSQELGPSLHASERICLLTKCRNEKWIREHFFQWFHYLNYNK